MNDRIVLDMNTAEALVALEAVQRAAKQAHESRRFLIATNAPADERAVVETVAPMFDRLELRLRNLLYPEIRCAYLDERDCDRSPVEGSRYCRLHADKMAGRVPQYAREGR